MSTGTIEAIFIAARPASPMQPVTEVQAESGRGLTGDRACADDNEAGRQLTLVEAEAVDAVNRDTSVTLEYHETRRNLLTRGVALNHLVGREFTVGDVRVRGVRLCEPCGHLEGLTRKGVCAALIHRGGLRAEILAGGVIRTGDTIRV